jgi:hypothetical protein
MMYLLIELEKRKSGKPQSTLCEKRSQHLFLFVSVCFIIELSKEGLFKEKESTWAMR